MTTSVPEPDGDTIVGDPRLIDVESTFEPAYDGAPPTQRQDRGLGDRLRGSFERPGDEVIGGVSVEIGSALGLDTLWVRLAFVVFALVGGLGVLFYAGLWLALLVGADRRWARIAGGVVIIGLIPCYISTAEPSLATGTGAVVVLLVGLTLALWNRSSPESVARRVASPSGPPPDAPSEEQVGVAGSPFEQRRPRHRVARERPPSSPLGRATLGVAVVVAALGALIDESNGGRLHPEQWLGAAAVICGVGLLVGTIAGRARWLILPAAGFAVAGFVGGGLAQAGVPVAQIASDSYLFIREGEAVGRFEERAAFIGTDIVIDGDPGPDVVEVDARSFVGDVSITVADEVTVLVRTDIDGGSAFANGRTQSATFTVGPDGEPDVVVDARVVRGDVRVVTLDAAWSDAEITPVPDFGSPEFFIGDGVMLGSDGFVFVGEGEVVIDPENVPISPSFYEGSSERGYVFQTGLGTGFVESWRLAGNLLTTPYNHVIDLDLARLEAGVWQPSTTVAPGVPVPVDGGLAPATTTIVPVTIVATTVTPAPVDGQEG